MKPDHQHLNALPIGHMLGQFRIDQVLGSGGFGIVYKAWDVRLQVYRAIKEFLPVDLVTRQQQTQVSLLSSNYHKSFEDGMVCFEREARSLCQIDHPNIVRVMSSFSENGTAYTVMEFIEGQTLAELQSSKKITPDQIKAWLDALLSALHVLHQHGILHRDIKPQNIMINPKNQPVLIDFGAVHFFMAERSRTVHSIASAPYTPLELYENLEDHLNPPSDIYALGQTFYELVSGDRAISAIRRSQQYDPQPALSDNKNIKGYKSIFLLAIDTATQPNVRDRFSSVEGWQQSLSKGKLVLETPASTPPSPTKSNKIFYFLISFVLAVPLCWFVYTHFQEKKKSAADSLPVVQPPPPPQPDPEFLKKQQEAELAAQKAQQLKFEQESLWTDPKTKLTWMRCVVPSIWDGQQCHSAKPVLYSEINSVIKKMNDSGYAGKTSWRLPKINELDQLIRSCSNSKEEKIVQSSHGKVLVACPTKTVGQLVQPSQEKLLYWSTSTSQKTGQKKKFPLLISVSSIKSELVGDGSSTVQGYIRLVHD